jgi:hypothetical protein
MWSHFVRFTFFGSIVHADFFWPRVSVSRTDLFGFQRLPWIVEALQRASYCGFT